MKIIIADPNRLRAQAFSDLLLSFSELDLEVPILCLHFDELMDLVAEEQPHLVFISIDYGGIAFDYVTKIRNTFHRKILTLFIGENSPPNITQYAASLSVFGLFTGQIDIEKLRATLLLHSSQLKQMGILADKR